MIKMIGMRMNGTMMMSGMTRTWKIWESIWKICGMVIGKTMEIGIKNGMNGVKEEVKVKAGVEVVTSVDQEVKDADQDLKDQLEDDLALDKDKVEDLHTQTCAQIQRRFRTKISAGIKGFLS